tara:strand:- start:3746 stop:4069 length:324 start_codon:yes stop_codon:yes gene_type:complete
MKKLFLMFVFLFALTGSYANSFSNDELSKSNLSIEYFSDQINDLENLVVEVTMNLDECTVSVSGTIGIGGSNVTVAISSTKTTCGEARAEVLGELKQTIKDVKEMLK